jgi:type IV secretory pathway ATPase VirB11/archaellum biosynthesis ATPase
MNESITSIAQAFPELEGYILDKTVDDIHINSNGKVFIKRHGAKHGEGIGENLFSQEHLLEILRVLSQSFTGDELNEANPFLEIDFPDGSNFTAVIPPVSPHGVTITMSRIPVPQIASAQVLRGERSRKRQSEQEGDRTREESEETREDRAAIEMIRDSSERLRAHGVESNNKELVEQMDRQLEQLREWERQRTHRSARATSGGQ